MVEEIPNRAGRVLVVQPDEHCPLNAMEAWLRDENLVVRVLRPFAGDSIPEAVGADGLIVLGGDMSSMDDAGYPWLEEVRALQRQAGVTGTPSLGICLGGQLMAQAFGGSTGNGDNGMEAGVAEIEWLAAAAADPVFGNLPDPFPAGMMHRDAVTDLPPDAVLVGTGVLYRYQAFRVGATSWAVQFHPEVDRALYDEWSAVVDDDDDIALRRIAAGRAAFAHNEGDVLKSNRELVRNYARVVNRRLAADRGEK